MKKKCRKYEQSGCCCGHSGNPITVFELVKSGTSAAPYLAQVRNMADKAKAAGLNIDWFPTNFVVRDGLVWYVDYECNDYMDEWSFESWGIRYWSRTPEFEAYLIEHMPEMTIREERIAAGDLDGCRTGAAVERE